MQGFAKPHTSEPPPRHIHTHLSNAMKRTTTSLALLALCLAGSTAQAQTLTKATSYGTHAVSRPVMIDSVDVHNQKFSLGSLLKTSYKTEGLKGTSVAAASNGFFAVAQPASGASTFSSYSFPLISQGFTKGTLKLYGRARYALYDGETLLGSNEDKLAESDTVPAISVPLTLIATNKNLVVKVLSTAEDKARGDFKLVFEPEEGLPQLDLKAASDGVRYINWNYLTHGKRLYYTHVSPSGKYVLVTYTERAPKKGVSFQEIREGATGKVLRTTQSLYGAEWMPDEDVLVIKTSNRAGDQLVKIDPVSGRSTVWIDKIPGESFMISPDKRSIYIYEEVKGPEKDKLLIRRLSPDDRQPGARDRQALYRYDIATGVYEPVLYGYRSVSLLDFSADGSQLLLGLYTKDWQHSPFDQTTVLRYTPATGRIDTVFTKQFEIGSVSFIPGTEDVLAMGSPNSFGGVGNTLPNGRVGNGYEHELFRVNIPTGRVTPLTRDFAPSVDHVQYHAKGKAFYILADNGSRQSLYRLDVKTNKITQIDTKEDVVRGFGVASHGNTFYYFGQSLNNADRLYSLDASGKSKLIWDISAEKLRGVKFTPAKDFVYRTPDGVDIDGWYYLPPNFDPSKKYPMIVYYYGGTIPLSRELETTYDLAMFAAQGYVAYSLNPRGTVGYGQSFAADHLNAWGTRTSDDIIGAVKAFVAAHPFVDAKKIGCAGASYGGFMTQYLQTRTDLFAAAASHAGISSISSYWAGGYWGMSYSTVASEGSYPWNNPDLYTKHSPLFNADKIHTPLLLLHGTSDVNVPPSESTAMYNALKILGRTVELIEVTGEDHHILEPERQDRWMQTIQAWFAKHLQGNSQWWDHLYPKTPLDL